MAFYGPDFAQSLRRSPVSRPNLRVSGLSSAAAMAVSQAIQIAGLERTFESGARAIEPLTLELAAGSFVSLLGPSGCGKSTLMRLLAGLDAPTAGTIQRAADLRLA